MGRTAKGTNFDSKVYGILDHREGLNISIRTMLGPVAMLIAPLLISCSGSNSTVIPSPISGTQNRAVSPSVLSKRASARWIYVTEDATSPSTSRKLLEFAGNSSGNAAPIRTLNTGATAFAVESNASFWSGPFWTTTYKIKNLAADGALLGTIGRKDGIASATIDAERNVYTLEGDESYGTACAFKNPVGREYAATSYGKKQIRSFVPSPGNYPINCNSQISVDSAGDVYISTNVVTAGQWEGAQIREYASSSARAIRRITFNSSVVTTVAAAQGASDGTLYALLNNDLVAYAAKSTKATVVRTNVVTFALDSRDDIYAIVKNGSTYSLDTLTSSGSVVREISGGQTRLLNPVAIAVSP